MSRTNAKAVPSSLCTVWRHVYLRGWRQWRLNGAGVAQTRCAHCVVVRDPDALH